MTLKLQLKCKQLADLYKEYDKKVNPALLRKVVKGESSRRRMELGDKLREARDSFTNIQDILIQLSDLAEKLQDQFDRYEEVRTVLECNESFTVETITLQYQDKGTKILREAETELSYLMKDVRKSVKRVKFGAAEKQERDDKPDVVKSTDKKEQKHDKDTPDKKDKEAAKKEKAEKKEKEKADKKEKEKAEKKEKEKAEKKEKEKAEKKDKKQTEESKKDTPKEETKESSSGAEACPEQSADRKQAETGSVHRPPLNHRHTVDVLPRVPAGAHPTPFHTAVGCRNCDRPPQYEEQRPSYNIYPQVVTTNDDSQLPSRKQ